MKVQRHLFFHSLLFFGSLGVVYWFFFNAVDPNSAMLSQMVMVYGLIFLSVFAFMSLFGYFFRRVIFRSGTSFTHIKSAERQAVSIAVFGVIILILQAQSLFNLWIAFLLGLIFILLELYLASK